MFKVTGSLVAVGAGGWVAVGAGAWVAGAWVAGAWVAGAGVVVLPQAVNIMEAVTSSAMVRENIFLFILSSFLS